TARRSKRPLERRGATSLGVEPSNAKPLHVACPLSNPLTSRLCGNPDHDPCCHLANLDREGGSKPGARRERVEHGAAERKDRPRVLVERIPRDGVTAEDPRRS